MSNIHRLKHTFTSGELSPLMENRTDFDRYVNGCKTLKNAVCITQGPAARRPGFEFIYDLTSLGMDLTKPSVRMIPFIFNETQAYVMIFFYHVDGFARVVFAAQDGGLLIYPDPAPTECPSGTTITPPVNIGDIIYLVLPADWDIDAFDWAQSADEMYIAQPDVAPHILTRHGHTCWTADIITFTDPPADWSAIKGWPEKVTFHQQRLAFAANTIRRQTVWLSKAGSFLDFGISSPIVDSDAVTFTLDSGTQNKIQWMISAKSLNIGTLGNEWTVSGATRTALTPENILAQRQTNNGSEPIKPLMVGLTTLFIERHGRTMNEFVYDYTYDSYKNSDITVLAPHLTEHYSVIDWTYQQTPDSIIWCVREDGEIIALTYQREHKVIGWHHHDTDGFFKAITAIPGDTREDDVWTIVNRVIDGVAKFYIERMSDWFKGSTAQEGQFLDSWIEYSGVPAQVMTGLDHLEGKEVHILADGMVHPPTVVVSGEVTLNGEYSEVLIGLPYITEIRPLLADIPDTKGTSIGRMQRTCYIDVILYNSLGMYIGRDDSEDGETEEEIPFRVPGDLTGQAVPLYNGIKHLSFMEGFDRKAEYFIRQKQPLPLTVLGVVDSTEVLDG